MSIHERFCQLIDSVTPATRRASELEDISSIPAASWQKAYFRKQRPTMEMFEALGAKWPQYAFWLVTGYNDPSNGHLSPPGIEAARIKRQKIMQQG